jgi:hypothetical protein
MSAGHRAVIRILLLHWKSALKMLPAKECKRWIVFILLSITFGLSNVRLEVFAQRPSDQRSIKEEQRWKYFLDQLALEARTLMDQNTRSEALAAVADAYWELSPTDSTKLFFVALDLALSIEPAGKTHDLAVRRVITAAARRNGQLARDLVKEVLSKKDKTSNAQLTKTSLDLLKVDTAAAETVALSSVSGGISFDVAWFIFELNKQDSAAADRVYLAYLNNPNSGSLYQLLWLAGYPFGYVEAFGGSSNPAQFTGVFGVSSPTLTPNRELAIRFLETANQAMASTLELATQAPFEKREGLNSLVFFTLRYLRPEAERYRPDLRARWDDMEHLSAAAISPLRRSEIINKANEIFSSRRQSGGGPKAEQSSISEISELIERAERSRTSCERDSTYARVALKLAQEKDFQRAVAIADKISNLKMSANVIQFVHFDRALAAMSSRTPPNAGEAMQYAERVASYEHRTLLYILLAGLSLNQNESERAYEFLSNAYKLTEHIEEPAVRAGLLIGIANQFSKIDTTEPVRVLKEAIRALNQSQQLRIDQLSILRRVDLSCDGQPPIWYGGTESLSSSNLIETLVNLSQVDDEAAVQLARDLNPGANRVRVLAAIAGVAIKKAQASNPSNKPRRM